MTTLCPEDPPGLLVSVRDEREAQIAIEAGADWIDLKEPTRGALGAANVAVAVKVAELVSGRRPLSAALGELKDWRPAEDPSSSPNSLSARDDAEQHSCLANQLLGVPGIELVKVGLAGMARVDRWQRQWQRVEADVLANGKQLVAVAYADWEFADAPPPEQVIELSAESASQCLLVDTFSKQGPGTGELWSTNQLVAILRLAKQHNLSVVLAGKITADQLAQLPLRSLDLVAVRSAVCDNSRLGILQGKLVSELKCRLRDAQRIENSSLEFGSCGKTDRTLKSS